MSKGPSCSGCPLEHLGQGFIRDVTGTGANGVYLLAEAAGEKEALHGQAFAGPAGLVLQQLLQRMKLRREDFWVDSGLRCRPPDNKLLKMPWTEGALQSCEPYLRESLSKRQPKVVVALGAFGLRRMLGLGPHDCQLEHRTKGRAGYVEWSDLYQCWVIGTWHPAYIMRGNWYLFQAWRSHINLALAIAQHGFQHRPPKALVDILAGDFADWARPYIESSETLDLATDMETPHKKSAAEDELDLGDPSFQIDRVSYAYWPGEGVSVPASAEYWATFAALNAAKGRKWIWNRGYDKPRFEKNGLPFGGPVMDAMFLWHGIQTRLPMNINFVAPLVIPHYPRWKHLGDSEEGVYSAYDSSGLLDMVHEMIPMAQRLQTWDYFLEQYHETSDALDEMEAPGVPIDRERRYAIAKDLTIKQAALQEQMEAVIPPELKQYEPKRGYVRDPDDTTGLVRITAEGSVKTCAVCGATGVTKTAHTARKNLSGRGKTAVPNPCHAAEIREVVQAVQRWARLDPFVPSNKRLQEYQQHFGHKPILNEEKKVTFDAKALERLVKQYKDDTLYPIILDYRGVEKATAYTGSLNEDGELVGGWVTDQFGYIHPHFGHVPTTGRLSCKSPNLQNIPRSEGDEEDDAKLIKTLFIPEPGCYIVEVDYASIEALLLGYFAKDPFYMRLATLGIHDYVNAKVLFQQGRYSEDPLPTWSDADLKLCFAEVKERFPAERSAIKKTVYSANYGASAYKLYMDEPEKFGHSRKFAEQVHKDYFTTFPCIPRYQKETIDQAWNDGYLRGVWGLINRFDKVCKWEKEKDDRGKAKWKRVWGDEAKEALAFKPQHAGSGIMKRGMLELRRREPEIFRTLRLSIHDSLYSSAVPADKVDEYVPRMVEIMSEPALCMPCPPEWGRGSHLSVGVEAKISKTSWADAKKWKPGLVVLQEAA